MTKTKSEDRRTYSLPEILRGLTAVAYANGNSRQAARDLAEADIAIPHRTLHRWAKESHAEDYERIRRETLPQVGAEVADEHMAFARRQIRMADKLADRLEKESDDLPLRDVPAAMRNASVGAGIHTDKARDLQGDFGTPHKLVRSASEVLNALKGRGVMIEGSVESEEDVTDRLALVIGNE